MTQGQSQVKLLTIAQFAQICRTTPRTIRFYEQKGLIKPFKIDKWNGYRYFESYQARNILKIKLLQNFHIPLSQIKSSLKKDKLEKYLHQEANKLKQEIKEKEKEYKFLNKINSLIFSQSDFKKLLKRNAFGPYNLFCFYIENGEYTKITEYIKYLRQVTQDLNLKCEDREITFYIDNKFNPKNIRLEIALICKNKPNKKLILPKNFYFRKYPKTKVYTFDYNGPYEYLPLFYQKFYDYLDQLKFTEAEKNKVFEMYIKGPLNTKSKYDYLTRIGFPVKN